MELDPVHRVQDEVICSICRECFTDPMIIPCGHNFCKACLSQCWEKSQKNFHCPECKRIVEKTCKPNEQLKKVADITRRFSFVKPAQTHCPDHFKESVDPSKEAGNQVLESKPISHKGSFHTAVSIEQVTSGSNPKSEDIKDDEVDYIGNEKLLSSSTTTSKEPSGSNTKYTDGLADVKKGESRDSNNSSNCKINNYVTKKGVIGFICGVVITVIAWLSLDSRKTPCTMSPPHHVYLSCPDSWIGNREKCYFFSEAEDNWENSQSFCSSQNASLAGIDTMEDLGFMMRFKGHDDHWIGLRRDQDQPWIWINGTEFNDLFTVKGAGQCAYLNDNAVNSARCFTERKWLCSKLNDYVIRKLA